MVTVTINQNCDSVIIAGDDGIEISVTYGNYRNVKLLLTELLNMINALGTQLREINEDSDVSLGEW